MPPKKDKTPPTTQRAYTLRLKGVGKNKANWRNALWATHDAVNRGAKSFGDYLLTLRGGLDHTLAQTKDKRILLALSWLSVESKLGAPETYLVAADSKKRNDREDTVKAALRDILCRRGLAEDDITVWTDDCSASLSADIREDAVWVNRSKAYDDFVKLISPTPTREEMWDFLEPFFGNSDQYLSLLGEEDEASDGKAEDKAKDLVQKAGQWLSSRFGKGRGANFDELARNYQTISCWATTYDPTSRGGTQVIADLASALGLQTHDLTNVLKQISGPGYKSATRNFLKGLNDKDTVSADDIKELCKKANHDREWCSRKTDSKGSRPYSDHILKQVEQACGFTYQQTGGPARHSEFAVMLDHAARRVSLAHTWIKRAEAERRNFEANASKMNDVPHPAKRWLDSFCQERSVASGALEPYRIRRRGIDGWEKVVGAWSKSSCTTKDDRIEVARALQDDPELEKFGDIQLFEALADDDAMCVWQNEGGEPNPQILNDYVVGAEAQFKKGHFKVPAYRHPDALLHPVFCDFGNSRWNIQFAAHESRKKEIEDGRKESKKKQPSKKAKTADELKNQTPGHCDSCVSMTLWDGGTVQKIDMKWQSKKLRHDLLPQKPDPNVPAVARADRLGRAASNANPKSGVSIAGLFEQQYWNGRLQAPRIQLEAIAKVRADAGLSEEDRSRRIDNLKSKIRWLLSFSAKLQPHGPWHDYVKDFRDSDEPRPFVSGKGEYAIKHADNNTRSGLAKLALSRLPRLRVLSVDLGHRYAAACAVWQVVTVDEVAQVCRDAGHAPPTETDLFLHLRDTEKTLKTGKKFWETKVYRRIAADQLRDGNRHPAPWARLDRQFLVKLQGEDARPRAASPEEMQAVRKVETQLGFRREPSDKLPRPVDILMSSTVRTLRLALKRHGDRARIAFAMMSDYKPLPGGQGYYFAEAKEASANDDAQIRADKHIEFVLDALIFWHDLAFAKTWCDDSAKRLWNEHIAVLPGYQAPDELGDNLSKAALKQRRVENRERLRPSANALVHNSQLRKTLHEEWEVRWECDDTQWKQTLKWARRWILPRGKQKGGGMRRVGGLSLTRIATITEFRRKVQVGFYTRLKPDGSHENLPESFSLRALTALEHLREQRVKQLASRISEAALGIGSEDRETHWVDNHKKRPRQRIANDRFAPCHVVVIENLTRYRPDETRTRRENRQLMSWSSSKVKKYLSEACHLNGLHLREVSAAYTSRQDSRTGAPGLRCQDVSVKDFMELPFWQKQANRAQEKVKEGKGDAIDSLLCDLYTSWVGKTSEEWAKARPLRIPVRGGEIFVSVDPNSPVAKGLQADLNAAANIGLRALMDPDWPGRWWYVPCDGVAFKPLEEKVLGSAAIDLNQPLRSPGHNAGEDQGEEKGKKAGKKKESKEKSVVNLWRDVSADAISRNSRDWEVHAAYQNKVRCRAVTVLRRHNKLRDTEPGTG